MGERRITADGRILERQPDGTIVQVGTAGGSNMPADPQFPYKGPQAAADLQGKTLGNQKTAQEIELERRKFELENQKYIAGLAEKGLMPNPQGGPPVPIPGWTPKPAAPTAEQAQAQKMKFANIDALTTQLQEVERQLNAGFIGKGDRGFMEYLPTGQNRAFDAAAAGLSEQALGAFRTPGVGSQSDAELRAFVEANRPGAWEQDATNTQRVANIRTRLNAQRAALGLPPIPDGLQTGAQQDDRRDPIPAMQGGNPPLPPDPWNQNSIDPMKPSSGLFLAPEKRQVPDTEALALANSIIAAGGTFTDVNREAERRGMAYRVDESYNNILPQLREQAKGKPGFNYVQPPMKTVDNTMMQRISGGAPAAAIAGFTNTATGGVVKALGGENYDAMQGAHPLAGGIGEIGGAIAGTAALGRGAGALASRFAPSLLEGGKWANRARAVGTDAAYGGIYGGMTENDPGMGIAAGAGGSILGRGVGKIGGRAIQGFTPTPASQYLATQGVDQTMGQTLGGMAKSFEDRMSSMPGIGDLVNARRMESLQGFNNAAFRQAGQPIGANVGRAGEPGLNDLQSLIGQSYDNAVSGVTVPLDERLIMDLEQAKLAGYQLPPDLSAKFDAVMANRVTPAIRSSSVEPVSLSSIKRYEAGDLSGPQVDHEFKIGQVFDNPKPLGLTRLADGSPYLLDGYHRMGRAARLGKNELSGEFRAPDPATMRRLREEGVPEELLPAPASITGDSYQQVMRGLKGYKAELTKPGFEQDYRGALSLAQGALRSQMERGGGQSVVEGLGNADAAYRSYKTLSDAVNRARNGGRTGEVDMFAPSQLNDAVAASKRKFPGDHPLSMLAKAGQQVLPSKIPDSGTAGRLAQLALPSAITGAGAAGGGLGYVAGGTDGAQTLGAGSLGLAALMALGGTKTGQKALKAALVDSGSLTRAGAARLIRKSGGLFGKASIPLLLEQ